MCLLRFFAVQFFSVAASAAIYRCPTCLQSDFEYAVYNQAQPGDTIVLPAGSATWGNASRPNKGVIYLTKNIKVTGQGDKTVITLDDTGATYARGVIALWSASHFENMQIIGSNTKPVTAFQCNPYQNNHGGFQIRNITYNGRAGGGYFVYSSVAWGLIDRCQLTASSGRAELIFARGLPDSWRTPSSLGSAVALYIEDCTFNGEGYVCDFNANARGVVRFCTINANMKVDGHGMASNTPPRGMRQIEVYNNTWTVGSGNAAAIEIRGGTGMVFSNTTANPNGWLFFIDYGYKAQWPNFGRVFQTPKNYPIPDQIGVGRDPKAAASEPLYSWLNRNPSGIWPRNEGTVAPEAIALYQSQTHNAEATFSASAIIKEDRDLFLESPAFTGASGIGIGTRAQMRAIVPARAGVGYWVTDRGSWNTKLPSNTSGQLYTWNGKAWVLKYTPFTYPYPIR